MFVKTALGVLMTFGLSLPVAAQDWAQKMFSVSSHDFGSVPKQARAEFEFVLTNLYMEDVHVASASASCTCTQVSIKNPTLKTYERGAIVATFNTRAFTGRKGATITVTIDRPYPATVQLRVSGHIREDVVLDPSDVNLGTVESGRPIEKHVLVRYLGQNPNWQILGVRSSHPTITADVVPGTRTWGQSHYTLRVRLSANAPAGYIKDHLVLQTTDAAAPQIPVLVEGWVRPSVTVSPTSLFIGELAPGQKVTRQVVVQSNKPFRVTSVTGDGNLHVSAKPDAAQEAKPVHVIPVTFVASDQPGKLEERIRITTDLNEAAELSTFAYVKP